jgi:hypothetical protein
MELKGQREVCPEHDVCASKRCGQPLAGLPSLSYQGADGTEYLMHVMCAPPALRKVYHETQANG